MIKIVALQVKSHFIEGRYIFHGFSAIMCHLSQGKSPLLAFFGRYDTMICGAAGLLEPVKQK